MHQGEDGQQKLRDKYRQMLYAVARFPRNCVFRRIADTTFYEQLKHAEEFYSTGPKQYRESAGGPLGYWSPPERLQIRKIGERIHNATSNSRLETRYNCQVSAWIPKPKLVRLGYLIIMWMINYRVQKFSK